MLRTLVQEHKLRNLHLSHNDLGLKEISADVNCMAHGICGVYLR